MLLPADFKEFIELMISEGVRFVMIGGFAYNLYRNPRATGDIDFLVEANSETEQRMRTVLVKFGFGETLTESKLLEKGKVVMLGRSPFRIDILTELSGVRSEEVFDSVQHHLLDGLNVPVISPEILLKNKEATGREKDAGDIIELRRLLSGDD